MNTTRLAVLPSGSLIYMNLPECNYITKQLSPPFFTVIVITKSRLEFLSNALTSLETQTYRDFEVILVNDGGDDPTLVASQFNLQIQVVNVPKSKGRSGARNIGLQQARGKGIAWLDDDDIFLPNHLEQAFKALQAYDASYSEVSIVDYRTSRCIGQYNKAYSSHSILHNNSIPIIALCHRKTCVNLIGRFDEKLSALEDWDFIIRIVRAFSVYRIAEITAEYRQYLKEDSQTHGEWKSWDSNRSIVLFKNLIRYMTKRPIAELPHWTLPLIPIISKVRLIGHRILGHGLWEEKTTMMIL